MKSVPPLPHQVKQRLVRLGESIRIARKRRRYSMQHLANIVGTSRETLRRIENGHPSVAVGTVAAVLWGLQLDETLDAVANPDQDLHGLALSTARLPQRIRKDKRDREEEKKYDF